MGVLGLVVVLLGGFLRGGWRRRPWSRDRGCRSEGLGFFCDFDFGFGVMGWVGNTCFRGLRSGSDGWMAVGGWRGWL